MIFKKLVIDCQSVNFNGGKMPFVSNIIKYNKYDGGGKIGRNRKKDGENDRRDTGE